jgi:Transient receptor potential (TRP) ion channel
LEQADLKREIGSFYEEIRLDSKAALMYTPIFIFRRTLFCTLLLTLGQYPLAQVIVMIISTEAYIVYLALVQPYTERQANIMSIVNECFVLVITFCLLAFVDDICCEKPTSQDGVGWFIIAWINLIAGINMLLGAIKTVKHTIKQTKENITKLEEWWKKRTANKVQDNF